MLKHTNVLKIKIYSDSGGIILFFFPARKILNFENRWKSEGADEYGGFNLDAEEFQFSQFLLSGNA